MALRGCLLLSKQCAFFFNFLIWLSGVFLLCISIYIRMDSTFNHMVTVAYPDFTLHFHFVCYFLISLATVVTLVGFFGCCSSFQESHSMLAMFIGCLALFLVAQLATACWVFMHRHTLKHSAGDNIRRYVDNEYGENPFTNEPLDHLQITYKCCGSEGPSDYVDSEFVNNSKVQQQHPQQQQQQHPQQQHPQQQHPQQQQKQKQHPQQQQQQQQRYYHLPTSCCGYYDFRSTQPIHCITYYHNKQNNNDNNNNNNNDNNKGKLIPNSLVAYEKGCRDEVVGCLKWLIEGVVVVSVVFVALQLLSLTLSICLCSALKRQSAGGYK